jgi:hypothetical protein
MSSNQLLVAGLLSALGLGTAGRAAMSSTGKSNQGRRPKGGGSKRVVSSGLGGMNPLNRADLAIKPPSRTNVPRSIPRSVGSAVTWDIVKIDSLITSSGSGLVETNFSFTITQNPQYASWFTLFDQYSIPMATVEFDSLTPTSQSYASVRIYTALDFDNTGAISTVPAIEEYDSCEVLTLAPEKRLMRSVRPSCKGTVSAGGGGSPEVTGPVWCDSGVNNVYFYGIRSIANFYNAGSIAVTQTLYMCFRNHI